MTSPSQRNGDLFAAENELDQVAGYALLAGGVVSFVLTFIGPFVFVLHPAGRSLLGAPITGILRSASRFEPRGIANLGVLVLMATPLLRVLIATVAFALIRWWRFALISALVLAMLLVSFFVAA